MASFSANQQKFIGLYAKLTGLHPGVVSAQLAAEEPVGAQSGWHGTQDWLNIGITDSGPMGAGNPAWRDPVAAAKLSAAWSTGKVSIPGFGHAAPSIVNAVRGTAGKSPQAQISALQGSGWAGSGYTSLPSLFSMYGHNNPPVVGGGGGIPSAPSAGTRASGPSSVNLTLEQPVQKQTTDTAGFQQAQRLYSLHQFLSNQSNPFDPKVPGMPKPSNPLLSVLPSQAPNISDYTSAQTVLQKVAGTIPLNTHPALHAAPSAGGNVTGHGDFATPVPQKIVDTQNFAKTVSALGAPYSQANHAASFSQGLALIKKYGTDCSGLVSLLLGPRGAGVLSSPQTTDTIESQPGIQPGRGAHITMWNRPYVGGNSHIFMQIGKDWFESGGNAGGVRQISNAEAMQEMAKGGFHPLHPRNM